MVYKSLRCFHINLLYQSPYLVIYELTAIAQLILINVYEVNYAYYQHTVPMKFLSDDLRACSYLPIYSDKYL